MQRPGVPSNTRLAEDARQAYRGCRFSPPEPWVASARMLDGPCTIVNKAASPFNLAGPIHDRTRSSKIASGSHTNGVLGPLTGSYPNGCRTEETIWGAEIAGILTLRPFRYSL